MPYIQKIKIERNTTFPLYYSVLYVENTQLSDSCELTLENFRMTKVLKSYPFGGDQHFHMVAVDAMKIEIQKDLPDYVAAQPQCPWEQMSEIGETIDDLPLFN